MPVGIRSKSAVVEHHPDGKVEITDHPSRKASKEHAERLQTQGKEAFSIPGYMKDRVDPKSPTYSPQVAANLRATHVRDMEKQKAKGLKAWASAKIGGGGDDYNRDDKGQFASK